MKAVVIPVRKKIKGKPTPLQECFEEAEKIRKKSEFYIDPVEIFSGQFRKIPENSGPTGLERTINNRSAGSGKTGILSTQVHLLHAFGESIEINNQEIRLSFIRKIYKEIGNDINQLGRILFRARKSDDIYKYVTKGLKEKWILKASPGF